jgi:hypothetical protein
MRCALMYEQAAHSLRQQGTSLLLQVVFAMRGENNLQEERNPWLAYILCSSFFRSASEKTNYKKKEKHRCEKLHLSTAYVHQ